MEMTLMQSEKENLLEKEEKSEPSVTQQDFTTHTGNQMYGEGKGTILTTSFNLLNTVIGSGFLTLPYTFMLDGYIGGVTQLLVIWVIQAISSLCIVDVSTNFHMYQYFTISNALFNNKAIGIIIGIFLIVQISGQLIAYTIIIKQGFFWWQFDSQMLYIQLALWGILLFVLFPLSSLKNLNLLHFAGYVTICVAIYIIIVQAIFYGQNHATDSIVTVKYKLSTMQLKTLPLFGNAYSCQYQITNLYRELKNKSMYKMSIVIIITAIVLVTIYLMCAFFGYFTFGEKLQREGYSNILYAYSELEYEPLYLQIANIFILLCMISHYPLPCFGLRRIIESLIWGDNGPKRHFWHWVIAFIIVSLCGIPGSLLQSIDTILSFTGSIAGSFIIFVFPGIFQVYNYRINKGTLRLLMGIITISTGIIVMAGGLFANIYELLQ